MSEDRPLIVINVHGGLVQDVYRQGPPVDVVVIDWDQEGVTQDDFETDPSLFRASDETGRELVGRVSEVGTGSIEQLRKFPEMVTALEHALRE
jgi:hypothetical protein